MSSTPFRFVQRRTTTSGRVPTTSTLLTGEIYLQLADGTIYFKDAFQDKLHTVITDAPNFGLNKVKFSGASSGQFPIWDGSKFTPVNSGDFKNYLNSGYGLNSIQQIASNNISSGNYSVTIGSGNLADKNFSFALGKEARASQFGEFAFSNGRFFENGDSQYSFVMGRATTSDSTPTKILINNSDKLVEVALGETIFFTANVIGAGGDKYISNEIRGVLKRSESEGSQVSFLSDPTKSIYALHPRGSNYSVNVNLSTDDNSLKIECIGDVIEEMIWFAKIDLIKIKKQKIESQVFYFYATSNSSWFNLNNWYLNSSFTVNANSLPPSNSIAKIYTSGDGTCIVTDIDNPQWVTPSIIDTRGIQNPLSFIICSCVGNYFSGTIIGNSTFMGANPVNMQSENLYFKSCQSNDWYSLGNWFVEDSFSVNAISRPYECTSVYMYGSTGAYVDIDNSLWKTPKCINTLQVTDPLGICIYSATGKFFTGTIIGNSTFIGANPSGQTIPSEINEYPSYIIGDSFLNLLN